MFLISKLELQMVKSMYSYEYLIEENVDKVKIHLLIYWIVVFIFMIVILFLTFSKNIHNYLEMTGIVINENQVSIVIQASNLDELTKSNEMIIGEEVITYSINSMESELIYNNGILVKEVILDMVLNKKNIKNNIIDMKIRKEERKFFDEILKYWRGES